MTRQRLFAGVLVVAALCLMGADARALVLGKTNLVSLLRESEAIAVANVQNVTDGIDDNGLPYTEITVEIEESLRGEFDGATYTFRQIGLLSGRPAEGGTRMMLPAPAGMPKYAIGDRTLLFLNPRASMTGFQTPVGLGTGKFTLGAGQAVNDYNNDGVFSGVGIADGLATANDERILATKMGAVNPDDLLSLVRRAVENNWIGNCQMWDTDQSRTTCSGPGERRPVRDPMPSRPLTNSTTPKVGQTFGEK